MEYDSDDAYALAQLLASPSSLEEHLDTEKFEKEGRARNNVYSEEHDMQWCMCQNCVKDVQIVEKVRWRNPSVLPIGI